MDTESNNTDTATSWAQLDQFKIRHVHVPEFDGSVKLFNNGRQQLTFEVDIRALDANGREVILNSEALSRIRLIDYYTGEEIPHGNNFTGDWYSSFTHRGYAWSQEIFSYIGLTETLETQENVYKIPNMDYIPNELAATGVILQDWPVTLNCIGSNASTLPEIKMSPVTQIYLSCAAVVGRNKKLAVKITSPDGHITIVTNNADAPEGNASGDGNGKFNSSVTVLPAQLKNLDISCYNDLMEVSSGEIVLSEVKVFDRSNIRVFESQLWCKPGNGFNIDFDQVVNYPGFHTYFSLYNDYGKEWKIDSATTFVGQPGLNVLQENFPKFFFDYLSMHHLTDEYLKSFYNGITRAEKGKVVIGGFYLDFWGDFRDVIDGPSVVNLKENLYLYDRYGNGHRVGIKFDKTGLKYIVPFKW